MFTVKLCKGHSIKLVEAVEVNVYPCGPALGSDKDPKKRTNALREIAGITPEGTSFAYYVCDRSKPIPKDNFGFADVVEFYDCAYIENARGATTETVHAY